MNKTYLILSFLLVTSIACKNRQESVKLIGKYCFNREMNRDSIFINSDKTYRHTYSSSDGRVFENNGTWKYDSTNSEILFEEFTFFNDSGSDGLPPGNWYSRIHVTTSGQIRLMYSAESDIYYFKD
jgi:hypothetical protein